MSISQTIDKYLRTIDTVRMEDKNNTEEIRKCVLELNELIFPNDASYDEIYKAHIDYMCIQDTAVTYKAISLKEHAENVLKYYTYLIKTDSDDQIQKFMWRYFISKAVVGGFKSMLCYAEEDKAGAEETIKEINDTAFKMTKELVENFSHAPEVYIPYLMDVYNCLNQVHKNTNLFYMLSTEFQEYIIHKTFWQSDVLLRVGVYDPTKELDDDDDIFED